MLSSFLYPWTEQFPAQDWTFTCRSRQNGAILDGTLNNGNICQKVNLIRSAPGQCMAGSRRRCHTALIYKHAHCSTTPTPLICDRPFRTTGRSVSGCKVLKFNFIHLCLTQQTNRVVDWDDQWQVKLSAHCGPPRHIRAVSRQPRQSARRQWRRSWHRSILCSPTPD